MLFRDRELDAQRIDPHDGRDARAARDVVTDADQPLGDDPGQRCAHGGVGDRLAGERDPGASALERAIRLIGEVLLRLILLARRLELRTALVELALRDDLLIDERPHPVELGLGEIQRRLGVHHVRNLRAIERLARDEPELRFDLGGVGVGLLQLGGRLRRGNANEQRPLR